MRKERELGVSGSSWIKLPIPIKSHVPVADRQVFGVQYFAVRRVGVGTRFAADKFAVRPQTRVREIA